MTYIKKIKLFFLLAGLAFLSVSTISPSPQNVSTSRDNLNFTIAWDNQSCLGSTITITYTILATGTQQATDYNFQGFVPGGLAGLSCPVVTPPVSGFSSFSATATVPSGCGGDTTNCTTSSSNFGSWVLTQPFPQNITFSMQVKLLATECGIYSFNPCLFWNADGVLTAECLNTISIFISPNAQLTNVTAGPICQGGTITGALPAPICTAGQGYNGGCTACVGCVACASFTGVCTTPFTYTVSSPTGGTVTLTDATGGIYEFDTNSTFSGTASFSYNVVSASQPLAFCSANPPGTVSIQVDPPPTTTPAQFVVCGGQFSTGDLGSSVTGPAGSTFSYALNGSTCTGLTLNASGIYSFTAPNEEGSCSFTYSVTNVNPPSCSASGVATITINGAPVPADQTLLTCIDTAITGTATATGGSAVYTFAVVTQTNGTATFTNPSTGAFTFTPTTGFSGTAGFTYSVIDSNGCSSLSNGTITINVTTPPIPGSAQFTGCEGSTVTGNLNNFIVGGTSPYVFGQVGAATGGTVVINSNGTFTFFPATTSFTGTASFQYNVMGGTCAPSGVGTITLNYFAAPAVTGSTFNVCPGVSVTGDLTNNLISPSSPTISFTGVGAPSNGTLTLNPAGPYTFTPTPPTFSGTAGFNFEAIDSTLTCPSNVGTITVIVHPSPNVTTGLFAACDNASLEGNLQNEVSGEVPFTFALTGAPVNGTVTLQSNGIFTFTPTVPGPSAGSFNYIVTSSAGCTAAGMVDVTINASPVAANGTNSVCGGKSVTGTLVPLVSGGTPPYFYSVVSSTNGVASVGVSSGIYTFTANTAATGGNFVYNAADVNGCSATGAITLTVNPGPQASNGAFTGCFGAGDIVGSLTGLVTGGVGTLTFSETGAAPTCGSVTVNSNGTFTFSPNTGFFGSCTFQYQVVDSGTPSCNSVGTVTVTVDEAPVALPATYNACQDTPFTGALNGFVSGGLPPFTFFQTGTAPTCGTVNVTTNGLFGFVPTPAFVGPCSFSWFVEDSTPCMSNVATATVNVHPTPVAANTGPVGTTGPNNICANSKAVGNLLDLMSVGTPPYVFTAFNAMNGTVALNPAGPYTFNPSPSYTGPASFQYRGRDSFGCLSNTATVDINVNAAPTLTTQDPVFTCKNTPVTNQVFASGGHPPYTFSVVTVSFGSCLINPATGVYTFTPTFDFVGDAQIIFNVDDALGCNAQITVTVVVSPSPSVSSTSVFSCQPVVYGSLAGLVSGGTPPLTFSGLGAPTCGAVTISPNGNYVYTGPVGPCTFDFIVTDSSPAGCTATGSVTITETATGAPVASDGLFCSCFNTPVSGSLSSLVTGGIPPYVYMIVGTPVGGSVILNPLTGFFMFKPNAGFTGFGSFQYIVKDSSNIYCQSNVATVTIQVPCCFGTGLTGLTGL